MPKALYKVFILVFLPLCTGVLLGLSAIPSNIYHLSFVAFIPLLFAADYALSYKKPLFVFVIQLLIALFIFYLWGYYWVLQTANLSFILGLIIVLIPFLLLVPFYILFKKQNSKFSSLYFIAAWLTAEFIQANFQLGSPFYNLGNNLGANSKLIQWYEYTGASGGTLWILIVNVLLYTLLKVLKTNRKRSVLKIAGLFAVISIPIIISNLIYTKYKEKGYSKEVLIIHPSIENAGDVKFRVNIYELMDTYLDIMLPEITEKTEYVILPETAITNAGWVKDFNRNLVFNRFYEITDSFPDLKLITGAVAYEEIQDVEKITSYKKIPGIRYSEKYKTWYYTYNAALQLEKKQTPQLRVKEGLVAYQEYAPYPRFLPRLTPVGIDFQFSKRNESSSIFRAGYNLKTAAFVCYEVVYNKLFSNAALKGAQAFFVILNEGWYKNNKVPRQFLQHSIIRAIENRRSIAHSSNSGISAFINQRGDVIRKTESKEAKVLRNEIQMNQKITLAARLGNYIEIIALLTMVCFMIYKTIYFLRNNYI